MKSFPTLFVSLALCALTSMSMAAPASSAPKSNSENETANTMGIITLDVATSVVVFDNFTRFRETGDFAICSDGSDGQQCVPKTYLTPEQYVAKFYPKARYVGFRLLMSSTSGDDTYLYLYLKKKPQ